MKLGWDHAWKLVGVILASVVLVGAIQGWMAADSGINAYQVETQQYQTLSQQTQRQYASIVRQLDLKSEAAVQLRGIDCLLTTQIIANHTTAIHWNELLQRFLVAALASQGDHLTPALRSVLGELRSFRFSPDVHTGPSLGCPGP